MWNWNVIHMQIKLIFIRVAVHQASLWQIRLRQLANWEIVYSLCAVTQLEICCCIRFETERLTVTKLRARLHVNKWSVKLWLGLKSFSEYLTWEHFYIHFHLIQVTISLIIYSHLSFGHIWALQSGRTCVTHKNPVYDFVHHESPIAQWLERSNWCSRRSWVRLPLGNSENLFPSIWLESISTFRLHVLTHDFYLLSGMGAKWQFE